MSGFNKSRAWRRFCLYLLFSTLPVAVFAATSAAPSNIATSSTAAFNWFGTTIFALAVIHTFVAPQFMRLAHKFEQEHRERLLRTGDVADAAEAATARHDV